MWVGEGGRRLQRGDGVRQGGRGHTGESSSTSSPERWEADRKTDRGGERWDPFSPHGCFDRSGDRTPPFQTSKSAQQLDLRPAPYGIGTPCIVFCCHTERERRFTRPTRKGTFLAPLGSWTRPRPWAGGQRSLFWSLKPFFHIVRFLRLL